MGISVSRFETAEGKPAEGRDLEQSESQVSLGITRAPVSEVLHAFHSREQPFKEISFFKVETLKALKRGKFSFSDAACKCCREESLLCT